MIQLLFSAAWFLLPAMIANMMPVFAARIDKANRFNHSLDHGRNFRGKRVFGDNKTYRGLLSGLVAAAGVGVIQLYSADNFSFFSDLHPLEDIHSGGFILLALSLGLGALTGDAIESFVKRQLNLLPGESWFPFDQFDYIFGATLLTLPFGLLNFFEYCAVFLVGFCLHVTSTMIGFRLGYKDKPI
jgi:CDP-2,3-bis-(O-geranylgeranyl)-sn-glycerol synthase